MIIGIDPGIRGAIAFITNKNISVIDMPIKKQWWSAKEKNMVDSKVLWDAITKKTQKHTVETVAIELVHSMPKQGVVSVWTFSGTFFTALTVCTLLFGEEKIKLILPTIWKKKFGLINTPKDAARLAVLQMYPDLLPLLKRKKDGGRADAILIGASASD